TNAHAYQCYSLILLKATTKAVAYTLSLHDALPILSKVNVPDFPSSVVKVPSNSRVWILDRARPPPAALTYCSTILAGTWAPTGQQVETRHRNEAPRKCTTQRRPGTGVLMGFFLYNALCPEKVAEKWKNSCLRPVVRASRESGKPGSWNRRARRRELVQQYLA